MVGQRGREIVIAEMGQGPATWRFSAPHPGPLPTAMSSPQVAPPVGRGSRGKLAADFSDAHTGITSRHPRPCTRGSGPRIVAGWTAEVFRGHVLQNELRKSGTDRWECVDPAQITLRSTPESSDRVSAVPFHCSEVRLRPDPVRAPGIR